MFSNAFSVPFTQPVMPLSWTVIRRRLETRRTVLPTTQTRFHPRHARLTNQTDRSSSRAFLRSPESAASLRIQTGHFSSQLIRSIDRSSSMGRESRTRETRLREGNLLIINYATDQTDTDIAIQTKKQERPAAS